MSMVFLSYVELYNNSLYDLLASELPDGDEILGLKLHEHPKKGMQISGSSTLRTPVTSANQALRLISQGNKLRSISSTNLNERSSRSHTVISFEIVSQDDNSITTSAKIGKINLVDLAGSERVKQSGAEGQSLEEAKQINKALSVLGDVLNSLSKHHKGLMSSKLISNINSKNILSAPHVPYRNSKLTMLLKDSLGGNAKTMMIATIRSSSIFYQQSIISLKYASRAKYIKCNPIQNITNNNDTNNDNSSNIMQETLLQVNRLKKQLHNRTEESDVLKTRLFELEKLRKISEIKGIEFSEESKRELEKEKKYKEEINNLQKDNIKEKKELEDYLRCIIHNHEGTLAEKEKVYVHLENQLAHHILLNKNLNNENKVVFVLKEKIEITNNQLIINLNEKENLIEQLKTRNNLLLNELNDNKIAQYSIIENNKKENDILNETINKLSISRNKYKKLSEEYKIDFDKTINDLPQYKHKTDEKNKNKNQYVTDSVILELKESLKACTEKLQENFLIIQRLENEKNEEIKNVDKYRNENNLLMENVVYIDSEWRKEIFEASEDKNLLEEKFRKLQNISQMDEIDKNRFKKEIKELSVELKDSLKRENDFKSNYNEIVIKIETLQSKIFKLQENEKENSEKNQIIVLENLHLQEKNLKNIEFSDNKSLYYENEKNNYEKKLVEIRKENEKLLNEKNENQMNSNKKNFSLENEIVTLKMMMTEKEIASDEKINNSEMIIEKLKKEFLDNLSCSQKNFLNSFQTEKQELEKYHVDVEANLSTDIDKLNFQFIELNNNNKIKTAALQSIIDKLNNDIIIIHNNNSSEKNNFEIIIENLNEKIAFYKINHEKIESEKNEYNSIILSLSEEIKKLKECSLNVIDRKLSEDKEEKMRIPYEEAISVLTKKEMKANNEFTFQNEKCQILENSLQNQKTETEKEKLIAKEIEKSDEEKKRLREEKIKNEELKVKEKEIMTNKIIEEKEKENDLLKSRLSIMILQEKNMFSSLKGRLSDLDEARSKLLKLQQSQTFNEKNSSQKFLLSEQQEALKILEEKLVNIQKRNISMEGKKS